MKLSKEYCSRLGNTLEFIAGYLLNIDEKDAFNKICLSGGMPEPPKSSIVSMALKHSTVESRKESARQSITWNLNLLKILFEKIENPLFPLRGLKICTDSKLPIPLWVTSYTDTAINQLFRYARSIRQAARMNQWRLRLALSRKAQVIIL